MFDPLTGPALGRTGANHLSSGVWVAHLAFQAAILRVPATHGERVLHSLAHSVAVERLHR
jgi:hypothetical protein